jgi:hypothetical protein
MEKKKSSGAKEIGEVDQARNMNLPKMIVIYDSAMKEERNAFCVLCARVTLRGYLLNSRVHFSIS